MSHSIVVDFPLCADPRRDKTARPLVERAATFLLEQAGSASIEAIILTGSLARGEGSVLPGSDGFRLLGDVELLVILRSPVRWAEARRRMAELSRQATCQVGETGHRASIEYAPAGISYLRRSIRPSIFAYDLLHHGRVLWGRAGILGEIRPFGADAIPREDALELTMNRMVELLILRDSRPEEAAPWSCAYQVAKTLLDLAGSALAFAGRYVSSYERRIGEFRKLEAEEDALRRSLVNADDFLAELEWATECKLAPTEKMLARGALTERLAAAATWAGGFWLWEMREWLGRHSEGFPTLLEGYMAREPLWRKFRGWVKFYTHPLRPRGATQFFRSVPLWLKASPRTLTYAAALLAFWAKNGEATADWAGRAASLLPVRTRSSGREAIIGEVGELWRWLTRNN